MAKENNHPIAWKTKNYELKSTKHIFKNVNTDNLDEIEKIQASAGNSCDRKMEKTRKGNLYAFYGVVKSKRVNKLSEEKLFSIYRLMSETRIKKTKQKIKRLETSFLNAYIKKTFFNNSSPDNSIEDNSNNCNYKTQHIGQTINIQELIK